MVTVSLMTLIKSILMVVLFVSAVSIFKSFVKEGVFKKNFKDLKREDKSFIVLITIFSIIGACLDFTEVINGASLLRFVPTAIISFTPVVFFISRIGINTK